MSRYLLIGIFIQCFLSSMVVPKVGYSQESIEDIYISLKAQNSTLENILVSIEAKSEFKFAYFKDAINTEVKLDLNAENESIAQILRKISKQTNLKFKRVNDNIHISKGRKRYVEEVINLSDYFQTLIKGKVSSGEDGEPLPGVSIIIKGTSVGTTTDLDGNFTLNASEEAVLEFSYIGFKTQEMTVGTQTNLDIRLEPDLAQLEEVVVIGYGTQNKKDLTGAIEVVEGEDLPKINATNPLEAMRGQVAGVQISPRNGEPGGGFNIRIRGASSVRTNNDPLIVVDGVPLSGSNVSDGSGSRGAVIGSSAPRDPLNFINQDDIESITILKDASSTAIYGSRGANGVILITTKSGKSGEAKFNFNSNFTFSQLRNDIDMMTPDQYAEQVNRTGLSFDHGERDYNWQDAILRNSVSQNYNLSAMFGKGKSNNRLSIGYQDNQGIVKETSLKRYSINFDNTTSGLNGILDLKTKVYAAQIKDKAQHTTDNANVVGNLIGSALYWNPTRSVRPTDTAYTYVSETYLNPAEMLEAYTDETTTSRVLSSISPTFKIMENLKFTSLIGLDYSASERSNSFAPSFRIQGYNYENNKNSDGNPAGGVAYVGSVFNTNLTFENYFTFTKDFSQSYRLNAIAGYSYYSYERSAKTINARDFNPDQVIVIDNLEGADQTRTSIGSSRSRNELQSYYVRLENEIFGKLLVNASLRVDGSSRFGENNKYGTFPAVGAAYRIVEQSGALSFLKLRANYGITGNQELPNYAAISVASYRNGLLGSGNNPNPDLKWETTTNLGVGVDFGLLDNSLTGTFEVYQKTTTDLIFPTSAAGTVPGNSGNKFINLDGNLENKGIELSLNYKILESNNIDLSIGGNIAFLSTKMMDFKRQELAGRLYGQGLSGVNVQIVTNDEDLFTYRLREFAGYDTEGFSQYYREDGSITDLSDAPIKTLSGKSSLPKVNAGLNTYLRVKDFEFTTSWYGNFGHYIYNNTANAYFYMSAFAGDRNMALSFVTSGQNVADVATPSTKYLEKGDFFRLGNITLSYTIVKPGQVKFLDNAKVFVGGNNLLTITDYSGFDPEVSNFNVSNGIPASGIDYIGYPNSKSYTIGLNIGF